MSTLCAAGVTVVNETGSDVLSVNIRHLFGDEIEDNLACGGIPAGGSRAMDASVSYRTGFGAMTSWDWWIVTWTQEADVGQERRAALHSTAPSLVNQLASWVSNKGKGVCSVIGGLVEVSRVGNDSVAVEYAKAVNVVAGALLGGMFGSLLVRKDKSDFREFMLRDADAGGMVTITLCDDGRVEFSAPSGKGTFDSTFSLLPKMTGGLVDQNDTSAPAAQPGDPDAAAAVTA